ncbi:MAG: glycosyltransferase family 39 protein [Bacteroidia bacterium]
MKNKYSLITVLIICITVLSYRVNYFKLGSDKPYICTAWDAFGYYLYLPSVFIYHDAAELKWLPEIDKKYSVSGGQLYQAGKCPNGNYVFKYLGGVAVLQSPFFFLAHWLAGVKGYAQDGFSPPYQFAIALSSVFYALLSLFLLRIILLRYFNDITASLTLLLLLLASNFIQYVSVDSAMSHAFLFPLYVLILYSTLKWHENPEIKWACLTGFVIGLATICRPTELIIFFIPLLWNTHTKESSKAKWKMVRENRKHLLFAGLGGLIGVLPQLIYWKMITGSFIYDVGSKWEFLSPHFRVLFGWEKGWFIYTPVAVLFVAGLFFIKQFPFRRSVTTFCLLNIYIIIAWHDWRYGASYSCRALVQSYPVFALPLAALMDKINLRKWRYLFYVVCCYLIFVNLFQIAQYNSTILHYDEMNRKYYGRIYLNPHPTPLDMSLLDTDELLDDETNYIQKNLVTADSILKMKLPAYGSVILSEIKLAGAPHAESWIKIETTLKIDQGTWGGFLNSELQVGDSIKHNKVRLQNAISPLEKDNEYAFYVKVPEYFSKSDLKVSISSQSDFEGELKKLRVTYFISK